METFVLENVTETTVQLHYIGPSDPLPVQKVGDAITYLDEIYDADHHVIGRSVGMVTAIYENTAGHLMTQYEEAIELADGTLRSGGMIDRQDMLSGGWARFPAIGTSGKYEGMIGTREWQLILPVENMTVRLRLSLSA